MKLWMTEFPADYDVPEELETLLLSRGFKDTSWHNDACPSFMFDGKDGHTVRLWIDHPNPHDRECGEIMTRFQLETAEYDKNHTVILASEDLQEILNAVRNLNSEHKGDSLMANQKQDAFAKQLQEVQAGLVRIGHEAHVEYPGYISINNRSYGTANGNWGWNDEDGNGAEFTVGPQDAVEAIVHAIDVNERTQGAELKIDSPLWFAAIAGRLKDLGLDAEEANTGGGIICIFVNVETFKLCFGTSGECWGADVYVGDDFQDRTIETPFPCRTADTEACAIAIQEAVKKFLLMEHVDIDIEDLELAFWDAVAKKYPQAKSGDFPPDACHRFTETLKSTVKLWLHYNVPEVATMEDVEHVKEQDKLPK